MGSICMWKLSPPVAWPGPPSVRSQAADVRRFVGIYLTLPFSSVTTATKPSYECKFGTLRNNPAASHSGMVNFSKPSESLASAIKGH